MRRASFIAVYHFVVLIAACVAPTAAVSAPLDPFTVVPVLFVPEASSFPEGYQPTAAELEEDMRNISHAMDQMARWYGVAALGDPTKMVRIAAPTLIHGNGGLDAYDIEWTDPERRYADGIQIGENHSTWGKVLGEVDHVHGFSPGTAEAPRTIVIFNKGAGGFAGGAQWHAKHGGGMVMLGGHALDGLAGRIPDEWANWWTPYNVHFGALAHELGHTWGMGHPELPNPGTEEPNGYAYSVMGGFWHWPDFPVNPGDPDWNRKGLHSRSEVTADTNGDGIGETFHAWQDQFVETYRSNWFTPGAGTDFDSFERICRVDLRSCKKTAHEEVCGAAAAKRRAC